MKDPLWFCGPTFFIIQRGVACAEILPTNYCSGQFTYDPVLGPNWSETDIAKFSSLEKLLATTQPVFDFLKRKTKMDAPDCMKIGLQLPRGKIMQRS